MTASGSEVLSIGVMSQVQHKCSGRIGVDSSERLGVQNIPSDEMSQGQQQWFGQKGINRFPVNDSPVQVNVVSDLYSDSNMAPTQPRHDRFSADVIKRSAVEILQRRDDAIKRCRVMACMRPMQTEAIQCLNEHNCHAFILTPTGSGKTTLIHACHKTSKTSVIFAPYRLLVQQLYSVLAKEGITYSWPFEDTESSIFQMLSTAEYVVMPYEAAILSFGLLRSLHEMGRLDRIFIDEVRLSAS